MKLINVQEAYLRGTPERRTAQSKKINIKKGRNARRPDLKEKTKENKP